MELDDSAELNLAFQSDLQAFKEVQTTDGLARLVSTVESYREGHRFGNTHSFPGCCTGLA